MFSCIDARGHGWRTAVFVTEFAYMTFELLAVRLLSPTLGASLDVWTAVICCVLAASALGNWLGGKLSRFSAVPSASMLAAAFFVALSPLLVEGALSVTAGGSLAGRALVASLLMFFLPSVAAGMLPPLAMDRVASGAEAVGERAGGVYAAATLGGLSGTAASGFVLIPLFGTTSLTFAVGVVYALVALLVSLLSRRYELGAVGVVLAILCFLLSLSATSLVMSASEGQVDVWQDTQHGRVHIYDTTLPDVGAVRLMNVDGGYESGMMLGDGNESKPIFKYADLSETVLADKLSDVDSDALLLGGAAYNLPKWLLDNTGATVSVVELDPGVTELAEQWFVLDEYRQKYPNRFFVTHSDGRVAINAAAFDSFDVVYNDTFSGDTPARTLATQEALLGVKSSLKSDGWYVVNLIGRPGEELFLDMELSTIRSVFGNVRLFSALPSDVPLYCNYVCVASDGLLDEISFDGYQEVDLPDMTKVFTDDWCPVERFSLHEG